MRLTIDPSDPSGNRVYATFGGFSAGNVWRTANGGGVVDQRERRAAPPRSRRAGARRGDLPGQLERALRSDEIGVFTSEDAGATWQVPQDGPANVIVSELFWMGSDLVAATFGRGLFKASVAGGDVTPPAVTSVRPSGGETLISPATTVTATFSEPVNPATLTTNTFVVRNPAGAAVAATVSYDAVSRVGTLTPSAALANATTYTATLGTAVKDVAGNQLTGPVVWSFATVAAIVGLTTVGSFLDTGDSHYLKGSKVRTAAAGQVSSMSVYVGAVDSLTANRQYQLAIYTDTAGRPGTLVVKSGTGTLVANAWNTRPINTALLENTTYWLMFNTNGRTAAVNNMRYNNGPPGQGASSTASVPFRTWPATFPPATISNLVFSLFATFGTDSTPPTVSGVTPINGATGVSSSASITATFSEAIGAATLTTGTFVLRNPADVIVPATVSYNAGTRVGTLDPAARARQH